MHVSIILEQTEQQSQRVKDIKRHPQGWYQPAHITWPLAPSQDSTCNLLGSFCLSRTDDKLNASTIYKSVFTTCVFSSRFHNQERFMSLLWVFLQWPVSTPFSFLLTFSSIFILLGSFNQIHPCDLNTLFISAFWKAVVTQRILFVCCIKISDQMC